MTFTKCTTSVSQSARIRSATVEPVRSACSATKPRSSRDSSGEISSKPTSSMLQRERNTPSLSSTYAMPPLMPAAKFSPVGPSTTTRPPVMYSQPWSPIPSTTAVTPELRTAKRSPASPLKKALPEVAP